MQQQTFSEYRQQCSKADIAFFDLMKSIADIRECETELSVFEIEQIAMGARVLNAMIARKSVGISMQPV